MDYRVDFVLPDYKVVLEIDGEIYHAKDKRQAQALRDEVIAAAFGEGWQVIHISTENINTIAIFVIVLLEYLNLPGFPSGVIMPLAGAFAAKGQFDFVSVLAITVAAGLTGSMVLYWLGYKGEGLFLRKYLDRFPKQRDLIENQLLNVVIIA